MAVVYLGCGIKKEQSLLKERQEKG